MQKKVTVFLLLFFVCNVIFPSGNRIEPVQAKEVLMATPGTFTASWVNPSGLLARDVGEIAGLQEFTAANASSPALDPVKKKKKQMEEIIPSAASSSVGIVDMPDQPKKEGALQLISTSTIIDSGVINSSTSSQDISATTATSTAAWRIKEIFHHISRVFAIFSLPSAYATSTESTFSPSPSTTEPFKKDGEQKSAKNNDKENNGESIVIPTPAFPVASTTVKQTQATSTNKDTIASKTKTVSSTPFVTSTKPVASTTLESTSTIPVSEPNHSEQVAEISVSEEGAKEQSFIELGTFTPQDLWKIQNPQEITLQHARLFLSFANKALPGHELVISYKKNGVWRTLVTLKLDAQHSNADNGGYVNYPLANVHDLSSLEKYEIKISHIGPSKMPADAQVFVDAVWIEAESGISSGQETGESPVTLASQKKNFSLNEDLSFTFQYNHTVSLPSRFFKKMAGLFSPSSAEKESQTFDVRSAILDADRKKIAIAEPDTHYFDQNVFSLSFDKKAKKIRPGTYTLRVDIYTPEGVISHEEAFNWGLLTVNTNKSRYLPNETAYIQMAALHEDGHTICDANLQLVIVNPSGQEEQVPVQASGVCGPNNVVDVPDYAAYFSVREMGMHTMLLTNSDTGEEITDRFEAVVSVPFDIERTGPTRIYPVAEYEARITVDAFKHFKGTVQERTPYDFLISRAELVFETGEVMPMSIIQDGGDTRIEADIDVQAGSSYTITYTFDAPNISPYLFLLGPLTLTAAPEEESVGSAEMQQSSQETFHGTYTELRQWQIASDDVGSIDPNGDGTTQCTPTPSGVHAETVDDGVRVPTNPNTTDFISCASEQADIFTMTSLSNVSSVTDIDVYAHYVNNNSEMQWEVELWDASETTQYGTTQLMANTTTAAWGAVSFNSLSLSQSNLDGLRVKFKNKKTGAGSEETSLLYATYAEITYTPVNQAPSVSNVSLNGNQTILLTENATTTITVTSTVSDLDGFADIQSVLAKVYRSGVTNAESCSVNDNNCYSVSCQLSNCSGTSCTATCDVSMQFHADPTDTGSPWSAESWSAWVNATDSLPQSSGAYSAAGTDVAALLALEASTTTDFGVLSPGQKIDPVSVTSTITATGNSSIDITVYGNDMTNGVNVIAVDKQRYSLATSTSFASSTPLTANPGQLVQMNIPKTTSSSTKQMKYMWWGIEVPVPAAVGVFTGTVTAIGVQNELPW